MTKSDRMARVLALAESCNYEKDHARQVTRLALELFDGLAPLHGLGARERFLLECAGLLHDVGWIYGQKRHHKAAMTRIMSADLPFDDRERRLVALVARYHRKALPRNDHPHFGDLDESDQARVRVLAGCLRVADGLDRTHLARVEHVTCRWDAAEVVLRCESQDSAEPEQWAAQNKADLLAQALDRGISVTIEGRASR